MKCLKCFEDKDNIFGAVCLSAVETKLTRCHQTDTQVREAGSGIWLVLKCFLVIFFPKEAFVGSIKKKGGV